MLSFNKEKFIADAAKRGVVVTIKCPTPEQRAEWLELSKALPQQSHMVPLGSGALSIEQK